MVAKTNTTGGLSDDITKSWAASAAVAESACAHDVTVADSARLQPDSTAILAWTATGQKLLTESSLPQKKT